jgi:hypothetical protein
MIHMDNAVFLMLIGLVAGTSALVGAWWQRRRDRRDAAIRAEGLPVASDRLDRIERIVESTALEVERVMEHQRFATRLMAEKAEALRPAERRDVEHPTPH